MLLLVAQVAALNDEQRHDDENRHVAKPAHFLEGEIRGQLGDDRPARDLRHRFHRAKHFLSFEVPVRQSGVFRGAHTTGDAGTERRTEYLLADPR